MRSSRLTDLDLKSTGAQDFIIRKRTLSVLHILIIFLSIQLIVISVTVAVIDKYMLVIMLVLLMSIVSWYMVMQTQRNRDLLLATEFQNALFASALGMNHKFCIIIKRDGSIVYYDRSFQDMFPDFMRQPRRAIDVLLEQGKVSREDSDKIFSVIERGTYESVILEIRCANNLYVKIVLSIEPIMRPSGFILLRGREFIESRSSDAAASRVANLNPSSLALFSSVMDTMDAGVYMTAPDGSLSYVNAVLEHWLGYNDGEITASTLALKDIVMQDTRATSSEPDNFEGDVTFRRKNGSHVKFNISQKVMRDDGNKVVGCTAVVHQIQDGSDEKKKIW